VRYLAPGTLSLLVATLLWLAGAGVALAEPEPEFKLGFKAVAESIPEIVGEPVEDEWHNPENGDGLQRTTTGMMVWRKADNFTAFTDGHRTWVSGPHGVQARDNDRRFWWEATLPGGSSDDPADVPRVISLLDEVLMVAWYGNPHTPLMGVLGQYSGDELAARLRRQAEAYAPYTDKRIQPAYELVAVVAQAGPGADGMWRRRESPEVIDSMLAQARTHGFHLILDVHPGHSSVAAELEYLRPWLEQPEVHLALDPEFHMAPGQVPGRQIGQTPAADVNYAIRFLEAIIREKGLSPKVLVLHQFTLDMLPDKENIQDSPMVDLVLHMDGFGSQGVKLGSYRRVHEVPLEYSGIKLFYDYDPDLFTPEQVMALVPTPSFVSYQ
jgi:hypothetical protein